MNKPTLSFVVPAHNEQRLLGHTLESIKLAASQSDIEYEIIVVDDASTDRTAEIAVAHGARVVTVNCRQISAVRNAGGRSADGKWLIFVDADTVIAAPVVRSAIKCMQDGAVGGGCALRFDGAIPAYWRVLIAVALPFYRWLGLAAGCFVFCTRTAFQTVGGFDEKLFAAEEAAISVALARLGRFVILRERVTTSGRKLRAGNARQVLRTFMTIAVGGKRALQRREGLQIWYGEQRSDGD
jgi:glycosyltransferase involved in cell wall biosynthesis